MIGDGEHGIKLCLENFLSLLILPKFTSETAQSCHARTII